jgi:hypothetical protein
MMGFSDSPSSGDYALGEARDLAKRLEVAEKRLEIVLDVLKHIPGCPGFEKRWAEAVPPPPDYAQLAKDYPSLFPPIKLLGG